MPGGTGEQLRNLLYRQAQAVSDEAVRSDGQVSAERIEALSRLARLVELHTVAQPPTRRRWPLVVVLGSTLLLVSLMLFARVRETEIELDLALSEASFVLPTEQKLTEGMDLTDLGASGLREIQIPRAGDRDEQTLSSAEDANTALRLAVASEGKTQGTLNLSALTLPPRTRVWVRRLGPAHKYQLSLKGQNPELRAEVSGPVRVGFSDAGGEQLNFVTPNAILLQAGADEVDLDLTFRDSAEGVFSTQLSVNDLSLLHVDESRNAERTLVRRVSTILSGTLIFESLNGQERKLRPGEMIRFEDLRGEIRTLRLRNDHIDLKFHGRVRGINAGSDESHRSLMPTWLEWLRARHSLSLFWGTSLYLFGLIAGALRWLRVPV